MEEAAWGSRGRLSLRRAPSRGGTPGGGESELWAALLRAVRSDAALDGLLPAPLPTFPSQEAGPELLAAPEVFTVGNKSFTWTPFPPARTGWGHADRPLRGPAGLPGSPTPSLEGHHVPDPCENPEPQEQLTEGPLALQSCPMCQEEFTAEVNQLDVDSHLAQCLAESTEDVEW